MDKTPVEEIPFKRIMFIPSVQFQKFVELMPRHTAVVLTAHDGSKLTKTHLMEYYSGTLVCK